MPNNLPARNNLYIDLELISENLLELKKGYDKHINFACDLRLNAFGMGAVEIMRTLSASNCHEFFVSNLEEAINLRKKVSITDQIFVWEGIFPGEEDLFAQYHIFPVLNNKEQYEFYNSYALRKNKNFIAAILVNNSKSDLGFKLNEIQQLVQDGYFTKRIRTKHLVANIGDFDKGEIKKLLELKKNMHVSLASILPHDFRPEGNLNFDLAIFGVAIFGCSFNNLKLKNSISLYSSVTETSYTSEVSSFLAKREMPVIKISLGLAHGINSNVAKQARFNINGNNTSIIGEIMLDHMILDASKIPSYDLEVGTEVEIIGNNISLEDMAKWAKISIEHLLTSLSPSIKRIYAVSN